MPFWPNGPRVSKSGRSKIRDHSPVTVRRADSFTDHRPSQAEAKGKHKHEHPRQEIDSSDCESILGSDNTCVDVRTYLVDDHNQAQMSTARQHERREYTRTQERERPNRSEPPRQQARSGGRAEQQGDPEPDFDDMSRSFDNAFIADSPPFPVAALYEQILLLRQHGIAVTFSPKSRAFCIHDQLPRSFQTQRGAAEPITMSDVLNPSRDEINSINYALSSMVNAGGDVTFQALLPVQSGSPLACTTCSKVFVLQQERDEHIGGGGLKCTMCSIAFAFPCHGLLEDHMQAKHRSGRNSWGHPNPDRPGFGIPLERSDSQATR